MFLQTLCHPSPNSSLPLLANDQGPKTRSIVCFPPQPFALDSARRGIEPACCQTQNTVTSSSAERKSAQGRNGINGGDPRSGEEAVYAGFGLEQTQRCARGVGLTMPFFAIKLSQEPFLSCRITSNCKTIIEHLIELLSN